jgi:hypothetical protein
MVSRVEENISRSLRAVLADLPAGASIGDSEQFRELLSGLEFFLPQQVLSEIYTEWTRESLDGILPCLARKTGEGEAEILGLCILISDQTVTPIHVQLQIAASTDEVSWLECRLGERGAHGMVRVPYDSSNALSKRLHALDGKHGRIDWVYKVTFGHRHLPVVATKSNRD